MHDAHHRSAARAVAAFLAFGCGAEPAAKTSPDAADSGSAARPGPAVPWEVREFSDVPSPDENPTTDEKVALGRLLFYDPVLSSDGTVACATCHSELWGMGDALPRSVGIGGSVLAGPGRTGPNRTRRNAQTMWNVGYRETLFWDGRASSLEDQVHFPFDATIELGRNMADVVADLSAVPAYVSLFAAAFPDVPDPVGADALAQAIAAFERTIVTNNALYDSYVSGDEQALTDETRHGMELFGEVGCASCHVPPLFSSERFADRGVAPLPGIDDAGRFEQTGDEADRNRFKVPTLRNAKETGPFFHTGAAATLEDAVAHEAAFSAEHDGVRALGSDEIADVTAFVSKALHDPSQNPIRPREVPSGLPVPLDGFELRR